MAEAASRHKGFLDGRELAPVLVEGGTNAVGIAKRRQELQRARQQALTLKQPEQPPGARLDEAVQHRWRHDRAGVDQQLCTRATREPLFSLRVARVPVGAGRESQHAAVIIVIALPGQQRRVLSQQLLQTFDVVVVNDATSLRCRPLQPVRSGHCDLLS